MHVGVAGFHNFEMLATGRYNYGLLVDINNNQSLFWHEIIELLKRSNTSEQFWNELQSRIKPKKHLENSRYTDYWFQLSNGQEVLLKGQEELVSDFSKAQLRFKFLADETSYNTLQRLASNNAIFTQTVDFLKDPERVVKLSQWIERNGIQVRSVYASNIVQDFAIAHPDRDFYGRLLPDDAAAIITENFAQLTNTPSSVVFHASAFYGTDSPGGGVITRIGAPMKPPYSLQEAVTIRLKVLHLLSQKVGYLGGFTPQPAAPVYYEAIRNLEAEIRLTTRLIPFSQRDIIEQVVRHGFNAGLRRAGGASAAIIPPAVRDAIRDPAARTRNLTIQEERILESITPKNVIGIAPEVSIPSHKPAHYDSSDFLNGIGMLDRSGGPNRGGGPGGGMPPSIPPGSGGGAPPAIGGPLMGALHQSKSLIARTQVPMIRQDQLPALTSYLKGLMPGGDAATWRGPQSQQRIAPRKPIWVDATIDGKPVKVEVLPPIRTQSRVNLPDAIPEMRILGPATRPGTSGWSALLGIASKLAIVLQVFDVASYSQDGTRWVAFCDAALQPWDSAKNRVPLDPKLRKDMEGLRQLINSRLRSPYFAREAAAGNLAEPLIEIRNYIMEHNIPQYYINPQFWDMLMVAGYPVVMLPQLQKEFSEISRDLHGFVNETHKVAGLLENRRMDPNTPGLYQTMEAIDTMRDHLQAMQDKGVFRTVNAFASAKPSQRNEMLRLTADLQEGLKALGNLSQRYHRVLDGTRVAANDVSPNPATVAYTPVSYTGFTAPNGVPPEGAPPLVQTAETNRTPRRAFG